MESYFEKLFPENSFPTFIRNQKLFDWLTSESTGKRLSIDVLIPEINLVIEFQGSQHFYIESRGIYNENMIREQWKRDITKYNLLTLHGYEVIYFVDTNKFPEILEKVPEKFVEGGYMGTTIVTNWEVLKEIINSKLETC